MNYATGRCMCHNGLRLPFESDDVTAMVRRVFQGRVKFHDGSDELAPGLSVHLIGGHSKGLQAVRVKTRRGWVVLASDVAHFYAHLEQRRVFPITHNLEAVLEGYDKGRGARLVETACHPRPRSPRFRYLSGRAAQYGRLGCSSRRRSKGTAAPMNRSY